MARFVLTFALLILTTTAEADVHKGFISALEARLENKLVYYTNSLALWLENVNDGHLGDSELGKILNYNVMKPKLNIGESRGLKKLSLALLPIIFHVGAASTWLVLTGLMAVKSVAIGILLLVFKIAVSSAKVASFFTAWKHKHHHDTWTPHFEHHGHYRTIQDADTHELPTSTYLSYNPDPIWNTEYKTLSTDYVPDQSYHEIDLKTEIDKKISSYK